MTTPPDSFDEEFAASLEKLLGSFDYTAVGSIDSNEAHSESNQIVAPEDSIAAFQSRFDDDPPLEMAGPEDDEALKSSSSFDVPALRDEPQLENVRPQVKETIKPRKAATPSFRSVNTPAPVAARAPKKNKKKTLRLPPTDFERLMCHADFPALHYWALEVKKWREKLLGDFDAHCLVNQRRPTRSRGGLKIRESAFAVIGLHKRSETENFDTIPPGMFPMTDALMKEILSTFQMECDLVKDILFEIAAARREKRALGLNDSIGSDYNDDDYDDEAAKTVEPQSNVIDLTGNDESETVAPLADPICGDSTGSGTCEKWQLEVLRSWIDKREMFRFPRDDELARLTKLAKLPEDTIHDYIKLQHGKLRKRVATEAGEASAGGNKRGIDEGDEDIGPEPKRRRVVTFKSSCPPKVPPLSLLELPQLPAPDLDSPRPSTESMAEFSPRPPSPFFGEITSDIFENNEYNQSLMHQDDSITQEAIDLFHGAMEPLLLDPLDDFIVGESDWPEFLKTFAS